MRTNLLYAKVLLFVLPAAFISRCCMIGAAVGALGDAAQPDSILVRPSEIDKLESGNSVEILLKDASLRQGKFISIYSRSREEYTEAYNEFINSMENQKLFPPLELVIIQDLRKSDELIARLQGFEYGYIVLADTVNQTDIYMPCREFYEILFDDKHRMKLDSLWINAERMQVPLRSCILFEDSTGQHVFSASEIQKIYVPVKKKGLLVGFVIGGAVDIFILCSANNMLKGSLDLSLE